MDEKDNDRRGKYECFAKRLCLRHEFSTRVIIVNTIVRLYKLTWWCNKCDFSCQEKFQKLSGTKSGQRQSGELEIFTQKLCMRYEVSTCMIIMNTIVRLYKLPPSWVSLWENVCSCLQSKISFVWLPSYIKIMQLILEINVWIHSVYKIYHQCTISI